ncbi:MAG: hypothetical protein V1929_09135 [bacterium]
MLLSPSVGSSLYVHSGLGASGSFDGVNPKYPLATLDEAIAATSSSANGVANQIIVLPGHAETLAASGSLFTLDKSGVDVIGMGRGSLMPTFTLTHATATCTVSAADNLIKGLKIISDIADCAVGLTASATADGLELANCYLTDGAVAKELVIGLQIAAACSDVHVHDNRFHTVPAGGCASAIKLVGESARSRFVKNVSIGDYSVANIDGATALATDLLIAQNVLSNVDSTAGLCITLHASTTGIGYANESGGGKGNTHPNIGAAFNWLGSKGSDAVNANSISSPADCAFS